MYPIQEKRAFTLIELLIVVAIIAILAAIAVPNFLEAQIRSKVSRVHADMRSVATAIEAYTVDYNMPPISSNSNPSSSNAYAQFLSVIPGAGGFSGQTVGVKTLTTPIAFIKALPLDPFLPGTNVEPVSGYPSTFSRASYWYVNYLGAYRWLAAGNNLGLINDTSELDSGTLSIRFNGPEGEAVSAAWYLASPGPDRSYEDPAPAGATIAGAWDGNFPMILSLNSGAAVTAMKTGAAVLYDTTNGTRSRGQIIRTSAGIAE